jgi:serine palmitoyltransferase
LTVFPAPLVPPSSLTQITDIEIYCATLDATLATCGGFCAGTHEVCNHQRLSGAGYCFSASSPPYSAMAAIVGLRMIDASRLGALRKNAVLMRNALREIPRVQVDGPEFSPLIHVRLSTPLANDEVEEDALLSVSDKLIESGVAIFASQFIPQETKHPRPSLRVVVSSGHSAADIKTAAAALRRELAVATGIERRVLYEPEGHDLQSIYLLL